MSSNKKRWALWGAGLGVAASISGAGFHFDLTSGANATPAAAVAPPPAVPVTVTAIEPRDVTTWQEFSGRLEAVDRVELRSRVAGAIQSVHFREGALVNAGDLLVKIDPAPFEAAVAQAESLVASAQAKLALAETELGRGETLQAKKVISQSDFAQRRSVHDEARANLRAAEAALTTAKLNLGYTEIRAPISGRAGKLEITAGNLVAAGSGSLPLTTLVSSGEIYASFNANEELIARTLAALPQPAGEFGGLQPLPQLHAAVLRQADAEQGLRGVVAPAHVLVLVHQDHGIGQLAGRAAEIAQIGGEAASTHQEAFLAWRGGAGGRRHHGLRHMTESGQKQDGFRHGDDRHAPGGAVAQQPAQQAAREQGYGQTGREGPCAGRGRRLILRGGRGHDGEHRQKPGGPQAGRVRRWPRNGSRCRARSAPFPAGSTVPASCAGGGCARPRCAPPRTRCRPTRGRAVARASRRVRGGS